MFILWHSAALENSLQQPEIESVYKKFTWKDPSSRVWDSPTGIYSKYFQSEKRQDLWVSMSEQMIKDSEGLLSYWFLVFFLSIRSLVLQAEQIN